jgi:hypothetical protein
MSKPCGPVAIVDLSPALARNCLSASMRARRTVGSDFLGGNGGGGGKGGGAGILGGANGPMHMVQSPLANGLRKRKAIRMR